MRFGLTALLAGSVLFSNHAAGFERDVHFGITKWLALQAGYAPEQADALAVGNQRVDTGDMQYEELVSAYACVGKNAESASEAGRHHYPSSGPTPGPIEKRVVTAGGEASRKAALDLIKKVDKQAGQMLFKFGEALHGVQDSWSHQGTPDVPRLFESGVVPLDVVFVNATPPDAHGFCSLGTSVEAMHAAIRAARTVVVQLNRGMPRTLGESFIHVSDIDLAIEVDVPPYVHASPVIGEVERRIGEHVAELVPNRATLQLGIGAIPTATALALTDKRDLGIHTEMFTDAVVDLVEAGVVTGAAKERNRGKIVTTFLMGSPRLYAFVHDNPMVEMRAVDFTNDTHVIRSFSRMVAINSAIEVDLTGQVVADSIGHTLYSGVGGQMDFMRGAALASEGRAVIALPSTAARGTSTRIVASLREGAGVVTTRAHVRTVVTEWGVAELFGLSLRERAQALIGIAHPDFRDDLRREAGRLQLA